MFSLAIREDAVLRPLAPWHAEEFAAHMDRAREHIRPWVGASFVTEGVEGARTLIGKYGERAAQGTGGLYGLWRAGTLVGGTLDFNAAGGSIEVGCWLEPAAVGGGLITDACTAQLNWIFGERGLHRAEWHCRADNVPSAAVARRLGMTLEGTIRENWEFEGARYDTQIWAVLAPEWKK
ncbi:N-acetyltransferase [Actinorhabdospora filicis]|uniref:N-acetyltransferase n=1 Tax=Actinorhabdospora filicis TaxID=1785913 RepID=A0A9W6SPC0_9ACTN|nr:GNAT family protein [Actinorhabdospora filicis]GLZ79632.1 N-acetyltransferase [Actinorhabdospora filicis]